MLEKLISSLEIELKKLNHGQPNSFDSLLEQISLMHDPKCISKLLPLFVDDADYDEIIFSLVHTIENYEDDVYVREIIKHLKDFYEKSPHWAIIIHMRIVNSPESLAAYERRLKFVSSDEREVVRKVLVAVSDEDSQFKSVCNQLLKIL